jgi:oxygen-independent coproporphyrinogen-3 oxidase
MNKLTPYLAALETGNKPLAALMAYPKQKAVINTITGELEVGYLNLAGIKQKHQFDLARVCAPLLEQWEKAGLIKRQGDWINLTVPGQFWQVNLAQALIDYCHKKQ